MRANGFFALIPGCNHGRRGESAASFSQNGLALTGEEQHKIFSEDTFMSVNHLIKSLMAVLLVTASASAVSTTWNGSVSGDWNTVGNWTSTVPVAADTATVPVVTTYPILSSSTPTIALTNVNGTLTVASGGTLNTTQLGMGAGSTLNINAGGTVNAIGTSNLYHNWSSGTAAIKGTLNINRNWYFATGGTSGNTRTFTVNVTNGGYVNVQKFNTVTLGNKTYNTGILNVWGTGSLVSWSDPCCPAPRIGYSGGTGLIDLRSGGRIEYSTAIDGTFQAAITAGTLKTGDVRDRLITTDLAGGRRSIAAIEQVKAYNPSPANTVPQVIIAPSASTVLSWTKPLGRKNNLASSILCTVRFGTYAVDVNGTPTDPNGDLLPVIATDISASQVTWATGNAKYQWRVDCKDISGVGGTDPNYPIINKGDAWYFTSGNQPPVVNAGTVQYLGLRNGTVTFNSSASYTDDGLPAGGPVTYLWEKVSGPAVTISPNNTLNISQALTLAGTYVFRLTVNDGQFGGSGQVTINVYANKCLSAQATPGYVAMATDLNGDCVVNFKDLAILTSNWRKCTSLDPADAACAK